MINAPDTAYYLTETQAIVIASAVAASEPMKFSIRAQNSIGFTDLTWSVAVAPAYNIYLENLTQPVNIIAPGSLPIKACIVAQANATLPDTVAVVVRFVNSDTLCSFPIKYLLEFNNQTALSFTSISL